MLKIKRMYGRKGFTEKIKRTIKSKPISEGGGVSSYVVSSSDLIKISKMVPSENLKDRQNNAPTFRDFVSFAKSCPNALFEIYIVDKNRPDERVSVDGVIFPKKCRVKASFLLEKALARPDDIEKDEKSIRWWWD